MVAGSGLGVTVSTSGLRGVHGCALIGDLSDESVVVVSGVGGGLDSAVGEGDHERSLNVAGGILGLGLLEVGLGVVIVDTILVGERLGGKLLLLVGSRWAIGRRASGESHGEEGGSDNKLKCKGKLVTVLEHKYQCKSLDFKNNKIHKSIKKCLKSLINLFG